MTIFNPFDPSYQADPYPVLGAIQAESPVLQTDFGFHLITRYADVMEVLTSPKFALASDAGTRRFPGDCAIARVCSNAFLFQNAPSHGRLRSLTNRAFAPSRVTALTSKIAAAADEIFSDLPDEGELDVVSSLAKPLPLVLICDLVGIDPAYRKRVGELSEALIPTLEPAVGADMVPELDAAVVEFGELVLAQARLREKEAQPDLLTTLWHALRRGDLNEEELVASCVLVLAAGHATTENSISSAVLHLVSSPRSLRHVRNDRGLISLAYEESLRLESPVAVFLRWAAVSAEIRGVQFEPGDAVAVHLGAANRDPRVFRHAESYALISRATKHLAFGAGVHSCLGFALARAEAEVALSAFLDRFELVELAETPVWKSGVTIRGLESLRIRYSRA